MTITDETDTEIRECITHLAADASRLPVHFTDKRAKIHREIDTLLTELDSRG